MKVISVSSMRDLDARTIAAGTPDHVLMERAGVAAYGEMIAFLRRRFALPHVRRATFVAGKGNNGGDAYVVARCWVEDTGLPATVYSVCPPSELTGAAAHHAEALPECVPVVACDELPTDALQHGTVIVDGLLGTGVKGRLRAPFGRLVSQINASRLPVVALDIPSGLDGDTGEVASDAVVADMTITMAQPKAGLLTATGLAHCGSLRCVGIGIPELYVAETESCGETTFAEDVRELLGRRPHASHKGTFGSALVVGGSQWYVGAPLLAGAAALRVGAGLSIVAMPAAARALASSPLNAMIVRAIPDAQTGFFHVSGIGEIEQLLPRAQACVFGPGVGPGQENDDFLRCLLGANIPLVIDADGLRAAARSGLCPERSAVTVLTPHPGEMRLLLAGFGLGDLETAGRITQASELARVTQAVVVLKGLGTVVAAPDGRCAINTSGTEGLASAGSGDVLAGMIGGFLAQGQSPWDAARVGVFLHGRAAELAPCGNRALVADDLLDLIGPAVRDVTPLA
ncbi:MAG: NAD(P)H-hydrate dehydratase [Lentisphaerae bacterium]|jgi:ADP-dependent NAD(P)H-hydrate dehydratase / NAD(P)H-hydrate epimerase|nr:NAD(P)H-hydrate dehydratase [Lentisphaerota bacterium]MBT4816203.1 NAD(P)H-hydrate dehydratase [Lentisphaerota bacterium]MBT5609560.1 NAD(P)H-hydrate dehydratase [Lentisphaerota bacterium]MBT7058466.1 NAD(P)H-hydrate dehydratase [Lentisphaerota bacterium]MBT7843175.1 NAD(P)H-hydrate dehydratase [Lentisphaerota bacterium]